jgi:hypothetical protein
MCDDCVGRISGERYGFNHSRATEEPTPYIVHSMTEDEQIETVRGRDDRCADFREKLNARRYIRIVKSKSAIAKTKPVIDTEAAEAIRLSRLKRRQETEDSVDPFSLELISGGWRK